MNPTIINRVEYLECGLRKIIQQATRKDRASNLKTYLVHDLDLIKNMAQILLDSDYKKSSPKS